MQVCETGAELQAVLEGLDSPRVLVPTMGGLHAGHLSLVERARCHGKTVVVTLYVNRYQFDDPSDFAAYPNSRSEDLEQLRNAAVDVVYAPDEHEVWGDNPPNLEAFEKPGLTDILEGECRPGHLRAVAAVVTRLFTRTRPDVAVFGEKDYQQLVLIRYLAGTQTPPVRIVAAPVIREPNGLALSSRNRRLSPAARNRASQLHRTLQRMAGALVAGTDRETTESRAQRELAAAGFDVDYVVARRAQDLGLPEPQDRDLVILAAARLEGVRLLDMQWARGAGDWIQ